MRLAHRRHVAHSVRPTGGSGGGVDDTAAHRRTPVVAEHGAAAEQEKDGDKDHGARRAGDVGARAAALVRARRRRPRVRLGAPRLRVKPRRARPRIVPRHAAVVRRVRCVRQRPRKRRRVAAHRWHVGVDWRRRSRHTHIRFCKSHCLIIDINCNWGWVGGGGRAYFCLFRLTDSSETIRIAKFCSDKNKRGVKLRKNKLNQFSLFFSFFFFFFFFFEKNLQTIR